MRKLLLAGVAAAAVSTGAQAALIPLTAPIVATGPMAVVYLFEDATDTSTLSWNQGAGAAVLVNNQLPANAPPFTASPFPFGVAGAVTFTLENITQGYTFTLGTADNGLQHFRRTNNYADFNVGALSAAGQAAITAAIAATGPGFFVGVEDRRGGDNDFNDLIYYFAEVAVVPGPAALGLFGLGLLGLAALRRRG